MPKISGFEVLSWIRDQEAFKHVIVGVLTGSSNFADMNRAYRLGANSYVVKPGDVMELAETVKRILGRWLPLHNRSAVGVESSHAFTSKFLLSEDCGAMAGSLALRSDLG